jgi:peroxiredoxin
MARVFPRPNFLLKDAWSADAGVHSALGRWKQCPSSARRSKLQVGRWLLSLRRQRSRLSLLRDQHKLRFPLLVDAHNQLARQFGLVYRVSEEQQALYSRTFVNLPFVNGDPSWELPIPGTFVIDRDGAIVFASPNEDYMERPEPLEIVSLFQDDSAGPRLL